MKALSIQQPWAQLIVAGIKPIENRDWPTKFRGPFLIHAGKREDTEGLMWLANKWLTLMSRESDAVIFADVIGRAMNKRLPKGGIIGTAEITDCVTAHPSPFFFGPHGFVIANAREITPVPSRGMLGFFDVEWPQ